TICRNYQPFIALRTKPRRFVRCWPEKNVMTDEKKTAESKPSKTAKVKDISLPSAVLAIDATPDGKTFFAACQDGSVFMIESDTEKPELLGQHESYASGVALL